MISNLDLHKDMGKLENQVAQLCMIFDKKMFQLNDRLGALEERLKALEPVEVKDVQL